MVSESFILELLELQSADWRFEVAEQSGVVRTRTIKFSVILSAYFPYEGAGRDG
jgi:hypothetical protein